MNKIKTFTETDYVPLTMKLNLTGLHQRVILTGYDLKPYLPVTYFSLCFTILFITSGQVQEILSFNAIFIGILGLDLFLIKYFVKRDMYDTVKIALSLAFLLGSSVLCVFAVYSSDSSVGVAFGSTLVSTIGLISTPVSDNEIENIITYLYPDTTRVYEKRYPFHIHISYALTHSKDDYIEFTTEEDTNECQFYFSRRDILAFAFFESKDSYLDWYTESDTLLSCQLCGKDSECIGGEHSMKNIHSGRISPFRIRVCSDCQENITREMIDEEILSSEKVTASTI